MRIHKLRSILAAIAFALPLTAQAYPFIEIRKGDKLEDLKIDLDVTRAAGAGTKSDPRLFVEYTPDSLWAYPFVIATPNQGVCVIGALHAKFEVEDFEYEQVIQSIIDEDITAFDARFGKHTLISEDGFLEPTLQSVLRSLSEYGKATFRTNSPFGDFAVSDIILHQFENKISAQHMALMTNFSECEAELPKE